MNVLHSFSKLQSPIITERDSQNPWSFAISGLAGSVAFIGRGPPLASGPDPVRRRWSIFFGLRSWRLTVSLLGSGVSHQFPKKLEFWQKKMPNKIPTAHHQQQHDQQRGHKHQQAYWFFPQAQPLPTDCGVRNPCSGLPLPRCAKAPCWFQTQRVVLLEATVTEEPRRRKKGDAAAWKTGCSWT